MPSDARKKMIESAATLLAMRGLQGTAFTDVVERSGAPRGSIYHHFPEGKDQLVDAAMELAGERALRRSRRAAGVAAEGRRPERSSSSGVRCLVRSGLRAGCAVLAVTVAADSPDLLERAGVDLPGVARSARRALRRWRDRSPAAADRLAMTLIAATEGAVVVSRAEQSLEPFELVAQELLDATP